MLVLIKSAPDTADGARGMTLAKESGADLVLLQNGVYFAREDLLAGIPGGVYVLDDDKKLRGLTDSEMDERVKLIDYDKLTDIMITAEKVAGVF